VNEEKALFQAQLAAAAESSAGRGTASIAAILRQKGRDYDSKKSESARLVEQAQSAITQGKVGLAKMYFRMALNDLQGPAREQVQARLDALTTKTASSDSDSDSNR